VCISGTLEDRICEYSGHLHEHFLDPVLMRSGRYLPPTAPGYSITMKPESIAAYEYPQGSAWQ
jgi:L-fuconate dehydratase